MDNKGIPHTSGIYQIKHAYSEKVYIGSAVNLRNRRNGHRQRLRNGKHHNTKLLNAWLKYGESAFTFTVLEHVGNKEMLIEREQYWIDRFDSVSHGYNIAPTAGSALGRVMSAETRRKMSLSGLGKKKPPRTAEHLERQSLAHKGQPGANKGKKFSEEFRQKCRQRQIGKTPSDETRKKMSDTQKLRQASIHTAEYIEGLVPKCKKRWAAKVNQQQE